MFKALKYMTVFVGSLTVVLVAWPLLWWLGRPSDNYRGEMVVDDEIELGPDDLGMDMDDYRAN